MAEAKARFRIEGEDATAAAFRSALGNATTTANRMAGAFKMAFAGISVAAIGGFVVRTIEAGDELAKAAAKSGIATKAFTELAYAGRMADVDLGSLSTAIKKMQVSLSNAGSGGKAQVETLAALGLEIKELKALAPDKQFELLADRISKLTDPADRARAATELFGKAGADLLPMFEDGAEGIRKAREEAERFGQSFSEEQLANLQLADDSIKRMKASFDGLSMTLVGKVAPSLSNFLDNITAIVTGDALGKLAEQIDFLQRQQGRWFVSAGYGNIGTGVFSPEEGAAKLRELQAMQNKPKSSDYKPFGMGGGAASALPPGFASVAADEAAKAAAVAANKWREEWNKQIAQGKFESTLPVTAVEAEIDAAVAESEVFAHQMDLQLKDIEKAFEESTDAWTTYVDQAARNMQDSLAQFLFDPFKDGLRGMLAGFVDMLRQMVAQLMASKIFEYLGGAMGGSSNPYVAALGSFFGGGKALGGPVSAGTPYMVGERGPELFMPGQSGSIVPNHKLGGGKVVNITTNVDARGATTDFIRQLPAILEASNRRAVQAARAAIYDDYSRGAFGRI